jgi:thymidine kinase
MSLEKFKYQQKNVLVFKPEVDDRYNVNKVVSHVGWSISATTIKTGDDVLAALSAYDKKPDVIAIDEMFMINGISEVLIWLFRTLGTTIVVSTLDLSSSGRPFTEVEKVLPWATHIEKCSAVCTVCGDDAFYTHKKATSNDDIEIHVGGSEVYEPRCLACHPHIRKLNT